MPPALYYFQSSNAPAPNRPARFGSAVIVMYNGQVLLEKRKDSCHWGIVSGDIHSEETFLACAVRRTKEETGIVIREGDLKDVGLFDDPTRIVCFSDGNIYRIVHIAYSVILEDKPELKVGHTSAELKFVDPVDLSDFDILPVNVDILKKFFRENHITSSI